MGKVAVYIQQQLYNKVKRRVEQSQGEFKSVEEYVEFVLQEVVKEEPKQTYTPEEEEKVKERLRALGYL